MGQINVSYEDNLIVGLDRVAAARRLSRPELLRAIAAEALEAHDAGRLAFQSEDGPKIDSSLNALAAQLKDAVIELDRVQRDNQRHDKKLHDAFVGSEEAILAAQGELTRRVNDTNRESYQPFVMKLRELHGLIAAVVPDVSEAIVGKLGAIDQRLAAIHELAKEPRHEHKLVFGDDRVWSVRFITLMAGVWAALSILLFLMFASQVQPLAIGLSNRLLDDSVHVCRLIENRFGTVTCEVPSEERARAIRIRKLEARR